MCMPEYVAVLVSVAQCTSVGLSPSDERLAEERMGKKHGDAKSANARCAACRNFDPKKKGGYCKRRDKKRSASDKVCGHFDPR